MRIIRRGKAPLNKVDNLRLCNFRGTLQKKPMRLMVLQSPNENRVGMYEGLMIKPFVKFIGDPFYRESRTENF
jgi:hypothetical protein